MFGYAISLAYLSIYLLYSKFDYGCDVYGQRLAFRVNDCVYFDPRMVVHAPFVRWDIISHDSGGSARTGVFISLIIAS